MVDESIAPTSKEKEEIKIENNIVNDINEEEEDDKYNNIILDTSAIIHSGGVISSYLSKTKSSKLYTVKGVMKEIRDSKSREALMDDSLFLSNVIIREPNKSSMNVITSFAKKSGDYHHLSLVDMQLLALTYELEEEGCRDMNHVRDQPKHVIGKGNIQMMQQLPNDHEKKHEESEQDEQLSKEAHDHDNNDNNTSIPNPEIELNKEAIVGGSWAHIVNPTVAPYSTSTISNTEQAIDHTCTVLSEIDLNKQVDEDEVGGQFSDADEDSDTDDDDDDNDSDNDKDANDKEKEIEKELQLDFPSLSASLATAEYSDDEEDQINPLDPTSDKRYNTFRTYRNVITDNGVTNLNRKDKNAATLHEEKEEEINAVVHSNKEEQQYSSRIMGGATISGQTAYEDDDDDDEGWITVDTLQSLKSSGSIHFPSSATKNTHKPKSNDATTTTNSSKPNTNQNRKKNNLPPKSQRSAIVTTDYAMQNIILQMNLLLLSLNASTTITQVKSWILRCQACFLLLPTQAHEKIPRIFCPKCGNAHTLQRISCKVNANTGRLILFRTKNTKKLNGVVRGMKYSVPKPTKKNRFNGDLLMREDQLFYGIWKQKIKTNHTTLQQDNNVFGSDVLESVGLMDSATYKKQDYSNIHAGFGRRNVNATKQGRERRGKKKKKNGRGSDKIVCGIRRTC